MKLFKFGFDKIRKEIQRLRQIEKLREEIAKSKYEVLQTKLSLLEYILESSKQFKEHRRRIK